MLSLISICIHIVSFSGLVILRLLIFKPSDYKPSVLLALTLSYINFLTVLELQLKSGLSLPFWTLVTARGSCKFIFVHPLVWLSICGTIFSELALYFFLIFCMKLELSKHSLFIEEDFYAQSRKLGKLCLMIAF